MKHCCLLFTGAFLLSACGKHTEIGTPGLGHGVLNDRAQPSPTRNQPAADAFYDHGGCQVYTYTTGQFGETVPTGWIISYCVCQDMPSNDPVSGQLQGGWTYPMGYCRHDWSNH